MGPNPMTGVTIRESRNMDTRRKGSHTKKQTLPQGEIGMNMKSEIGVRHLQVKEGLRWPPNHWKLGRSMEQILPPAFRRKGPCEHLDLRCLASRIVRQ